MCLGIRCYALKGLLRRARNKGLLPSGKKKGGDILNTKFCCCFFSLARALIRVNVRVRAAPWRGVGLVVADAAPGTPRAAALMELATALVFRAVHATVFQFVHAAADSKHRDRLWRRKARRVKQWPHMHLPSLFMRLSFSRQPLTSAISPSPQPSILHLSYQPLTSAINPSPQPPTLHLNHQPLTSAINPSPQPSTLNTTRCSSRPLCVFALSSKVELVLSPK